MTNETFVKAQLAARAHRDGSPHGGLDNMMAIAFVMRNRQQAGWHGGNWIDIIGTADEVAGTLYPPTTPNLRDVAFKMMLQQIDDVYSGMALDKITERALYYGELNNLRPWFLENIARDPVNHPRIATVGTVTFFL